MQQVKECIDCGSEYCPCYLSEIGECIVCSQLQGETFCDCLNWKGVCVYQEYVWNRSQMKEGRSSLLCDLINIEQVSDAVLVLTIAVNKTLARELNQPGAYVFLRNMEDPNFFDTPMSIMSANLEEATITTAIQVKGVKTKSLTESTKQVLLRGPYWNGLLGLKHVKSLMNSRALLVVRGIAQAPAVSVARKLISGGNKVDILLDKGKAEVNFAEQSFLDMGCTVHPISLLDKNLRVPNATLDYIKAFINENGVQLVYSGGTDKLHEGISNIIKASSQEVYFTCSNDARFCCGEGVCGSCHTRLEDGSRIKTCKTQLNPAEIF